MKKTIKTSNNLILRGLIESEDLKAIKSYLKSTPKEIVLQKDSDGRNALYYAIFTRNINIIKTLIKYGFNPADIDDLTGATTLHFAASEAIFDLVIYLICDLQMDVNAPDNENLNPLYYALMFLNTTDTNFIGSTEHLKIAYLLVSYGATFQDDMFSMQSELEYFEKALLHSIHNGVKKIDNEHFVRHTNFIKFLKDSLDYHQRFFKDICTNLPNKSIYSSHNFKNKENKIPLAFGWQISTWNTNDKHNQVLMSLSEKEMKPVVYDLATISPLLVNPGDTESETIVLFNNFAVSLKDRLKPTMAKQINITTQPNINFTTGQDCYFKQTITVTNSKDIKQTIIDLSNEIDRRKKLSKYKLKTETPILCWIDDLSQIKTTIGELQNITFSGKDVGIYLIAIARGKLPGIIRANFQSIITFHTATASESKKYIGYPNATELELDEMFFTSPFVDTGMPIHIKMEKI